MKKLIKTIKNKDNQKLFLIYFVGFPIIGIIASLNRDFLLFSMITLLITSILVTIFSN